MQDFSCICKLKGMAMNVSIRILTSGLVAALAASLIAGMAPAAATPGDSPRPVALTLPAPTGEHRIGKVSLHLVDPSRRDPWVPSHPLRELMISIWYPATGTSHYPTA